MFIDFKQVYGNIVRNKLCKNLIQLGIPTKIIHLIQLCNNNNTKCVARIEEEL